MNFLLIFAIGLLMLPSPAMAQSEDDANFGRGFEPKMYYSGLGVDNVNTYNGNLTISIPIGPELKHHANLSLQLSMHYNSKLWDLEATGEHPQERIAFLEGRSNVGLGWSMHLGKIVTLQPSEVDSP